MEEVINNLKALNSIVSDIDTRLREKDVETDVAELEILQAKKACHNAITVTHGEQGGEEWSKAYKDIKRLQQEVVKQAVYRLALHEVRQLIVDQYETIAEQSYAEAKEGVPDYPLTDIDIKAYKAKQSKEVA
jgi:hypothetical protein